MQNKSWLSAFALILVLTSVSVSAATPRILVPWGGSTFDHTTTIKNAFEAAMQYNAVLEFEAGRVYRTRQLNLWRTSSGTDETMAAGIEGNGAILKWLENDTPAAGAVLMYVSEPRFRRNSGFFIRNLTLDCGNNDIPTFAERLGEHKGLKDGGQTGRMSAGDSACDYGLLLLAVENSLIENVTVLRANAAGIYVRSTHSHAVNQVLFRQVNSRYSEGDGWRFEWLDPGYEAEVKITDIRMENCYSSGNSRNGYTISDVQGIQMVGCGAEKNKNWNIFLQKTVSHVDIFGGYTEKSNYDLVQPPTRHVDDRNIGIEEVVTNDPKPVRTTVKSLRIVGGRLIGRFRYNYVSAQDDYLIHSYGHTPQGFGTGSLPLAGGTEPLAARYRRSIGQQTLLNEIHPAYYEIPWYYKYHEGITIDSTPATTKAAWRADLLRKYNIVMVPHHGGTDQTTDIAAAIAAAVNKNNDGAGPSRILAFEPGMVYQASAVAFQGVAEGAPNFGRGAMIGIDGNHATLIPASSASGGVFVELSTFHVSQDAENDHYTFWMRDLNIDAKLKFETALRVTRGKWFHLRNVDVSGATERGLELSGISSSSLYYGTLNAVRSHHNGDERNAADGMYVYAEPPHRSESLLNNIGLYHCRSQFNTNHGLNLYKGTITLEECVISENTNYAINAGMSRSLDLFNCTVIGGRSGSGVKEIHLRYASESEGMDPGWMYGFHYFGGIFRNGLNRPGVAGAIDADEANYGHGARHNVVHTTDHGGMAAAGRTFVIGTMAPVSGGRTVAEGSDGP